MSLFRVVLLLAVVSALASAGAAVVSGSPQALGVPSQTNFQAGTAPNTSPLSGSVVLLGGLALLVLIVILVLIIISWLRWRDGVRELNLSAGEYGPAHAQEAAAARRDYGFTIWTFVGYVLTIIVVAAVAAAVIASTVLSGFPNNPTGTLTSAQAAALHNEFLGIFVFAIVGGTVFQFLLFYFASRSLKSTFYSLANPEQRSALDRARTWIIVGPLLALATVLALLTPYWDLVGILPPLLIFVGFSAYLTVFDQWLAHPPAPSAAVGFFPPPPAPFR